MLYLATTILIVYFFPKGGKFKYDFQKGKPWQYETLIAPFDIAIQKNNDELTQERQAITNAIIPYYQLDQQKQQAIHKAYTQELASKYPNRPHNDSISKIIALSEALFKEVFKNGTLADEPALIGKQINIIKGKSVIEMPYNELVTPSNLRQKVAAYTADYPASQSMLYNAILEAFDTTLAYSKTYTQQELDQQLNNIVLTRGSVLEGARVISKGEVVEGKRLEILNSLKKQYESEIWLKSSHYWIVIGYSILIALTLLILLLFLRAYRTAIFNHNTKLSFIFFNLLLMVVITTFVVRYNTKFVYVVPLCILPLILKAFFDARLGLFVHVLTVLLLGFIVPNSFEFIFLQIVAGIVTILTFSEAYKRANLFISVGQITLIYILGYFAFYIIHEGHITHIKWENFAYFILNGLLLLASFPLIYIYEKSFGLVSDVSLLELSDTNSKLLKSLSDKAPGTFHHSLQVANLAEASANEIGANAMLVRVGALYHDIGKMKNPSFFTENQVNSINPHNELLPSESARIIIDHVLEGIKIAKKNNIPDRVIDFIRTHHGTSLVYYFYTEQQKLSQQVDENNFRYRGPLPFSKETAILMMCDAVEAASKSLKVPTVELIDQFVEKIIEGQKTQKQFLNADITLKEIEQIKKVLKQKLTNIYHLRVTYPE